MRHLLGSVLPRPLPAVIPSPTSQRPQRGSQFTALTLDGGDGVESFVPGELVEDLGVAQDNLEAVGDIVHQRGDDDTIGYAGPSRRSCDAKPYVGI